MKECEKKTRAQLIEMQDAQYREFSAKLIPTVDPKKVIGVRTPALRSYAKKLAKAPEAEEYLDTLPHEYLEENNLHGMLIEAKKDYPEVIRRLDEFLPFVDNWATCDLMSPKIFKKHTEELLEKIRLWLESEHTYTIRFGIKMLMSFYLDANFSPEYPELVAGIISDEYYVNMMTAWYFATALAKQYDAVLPYIENRRLDIWTHNKAIQKSVESFRLNDEQKDYLRSLRVKK